jgi:hypothetical protein
MISEQDAVLERANSYVLSRGWRQEPLSWEEVKVLVGMTFGPDMADFDAGYDEGYQNGLKAGRAQAAEQKVAS